MLHLSFLNQVLPSSNIELRNKCLEKQIPFSSSDSDENTTKRIHRLITEIYRKEIEYHSRIENVKVNFSDISDIQLADAYNHACNTNSGVLSFKSLETYMKNNHYQFGKEDYESLMRRLDRGKRGRVNFSDFRDNILLSRIAPSSQRVTDNLEVLKQENESRTNQRTNDEQFLGQTGVERRETPKKFFKNRSPQVISTTPFLDEEISNSNNLINKQLISPIGNSYAHPNLSSNKKNNDNTNGIFLEESHAPSNFYQKEVTSGDDIIPSRYYSEQIDAIRSDPIYQTSSQKFNVGKQPLNQMENRYNDPSYQTYANYSKEHNSTIGPNLSTYRYQTSNDLNKYQNYKPRLEGSPKPNKTYFNPSLLDNAHKPDLSRYPENPFKHTDHAHYFRNYYANLKSNYYEQHYKGSLLEREQTDIPNNPIKTERFEPHFLTYETLKEEPIKFYPTKYSNYSDRVNTYSYQHTYRSYERNKFPEQNLSKKLQPSLSADIVNKEQMQIEFRPHENREGQSLSSYVKISHPPTYTNPKNNEDISTRRYTPRYEPKSHYTPISKIRIPDEKPRSAIKIEETKPSDHETKRSYSASRINNPASNPILINNSSSNIPTTHVEATSQDSYSKPYKFRNDQYESLWNNTDEQQQIDY